MISKLAMIFLILLGLGMLVRLAIPKLASTSVATGRVTATAQTEKLGDCPETPNCQSTSASRIEQLAAPIPFIRLQADDVLPRVIQILSESKTGLSGFTIVSNDKRYLHATVRSKLWGFIDDLELLINEEQQLIQIRSASRLGISDLGANKKRIQQITALLSDQL